MISVQRPRHAKSSVHTSLAPMHLHMLHFFLQPHFVSSLQTSEASGVVNHSGVVLLSRLINQPNLIISLSSIFNFNFLFFFMHFCPGTMTTHAESINSHLQRELDRRLRHTTLNTEQKQLAIKVSADN